MMILDPGSSRGIVPFCPFQCPAGHSILQQALRPSRPKQVRSSAQLWASRTSTAAAVSAVKKRDCPLASASRFRTIPIREKNRHSLGLGWRKAKEAAKYSASTAHTTARIISANRSTTGSREYS